MADDLTGILAADPDALAFARETLGPDATEADVQALADQRADRDAPELTQETPR